MCSANAQHVRAKQNLLHHNQPQQKFLSSKAGQLEETDYKLPRTKFHQSLAFMCIQNVTCNVIFPHFHGSSCAESWPIWVPMKCLRTLAAQALPKTTVLVGIEGVSFLTAVTQNWRFGWFSFSIGWFLGSSRWFSRVPNLRCKFGMTHKATKMTNNLSSTTLCNSISKISVFRATYYN